MEGGTTEASLATSPKHAPFLGVRFRSLQPAPLPDAARSLHRLRQALVQLIRIKPLAPTPDTVQRQRQLPHHTDHRRLPFTTPRGLLTQIPAPHRFLLQPTQRRHVQPTTHLRRTTLAED